MLGKGRAQERLSGVDAQEPQLPPCTMGLFLSVHFIEFPSREIYDHIYQHTEIYNIHDIFYNINQPLQDETPGAHPPWGAALISPLPS